MLTDLEITLYSEKKLDYSISSLMQGVLMEYIDETFADEIHKTGLNPYSQHVEIEGNIIKWHIMTMTKHAKDKIIKPLLNNEIIELHIKYKDVKLLITNKKIEERTYLDLLESTYFGDCMPYINIQFLTPTAFKVNGKYQFYPTIHNIFRSLVKKHDVISSDTEIFSKELMEEIEKNVEITRYNLRSTNFYLEGVKIPAFIGSISIRVHGPSQFTNLVNMLTEFGYYSGIGIKTGIGMGAIKILKR